MVIISIIFYVLLAGFFIFSEEKFQSVYMIIGTCASTFFAFSFHLKGKIWPVVIYSALGLICIFFRSAALYEPNADKEAKPEKKAYSANKTVAGLLALFLGSFGIHKFYLRKTSLGLLYLLFFWTYVPAVIGVIEAIILFVMSESDFAAKYKITFVGKSKDRKIHLIENEYEKIPDELCSDEEEINDTRAENDSAEDGVNLSGLYSCGYKVTARGNTDDFIIALQKDGKDYRFKVKKGIIAAYRSDMMSKYNNYEVH